MLGKSNCKRIRLVPEQSVLQPSTSMGAVPLLMSLSFVGSLLAITAPDCPALSWHQKGMRIDCLFFWKLAQNAFRRRFGKGKCRRIRLVPEQTVLKPSYLYRHRTTMNRTVPCWQLAWNANAKLPSPALAPRRNIIDSAFSGIWFRMHLDDVLEHHVTCTCNTNPIGSRTIGLETFQPLWAKVHD